MTSKQEFFQLFQSRIHILDGAMGTMIQGHKLTEDDYRGHRFANYDHAIKGNNDLLNLTQPEIIQGIHEQFLAAGADIIETNTFNANRVSMADYHMEDLSYEMNKVGAEIARKAADKFSKQTPNKPRYVAGSLGPTTKLASMSPDVSNPGFRAITFDDLHKAFKEQAEGLLDGGADLLLIETITDTLNCKAAIYAILEIGDERGIDIPIMISGTITDNSGRTLSGQTVEAFWNSIAHADPVSVGLNCALGAELMRPFLKNLSDVATCAVSSHPNAGLPNEMGEYDESPEYMATVVGEFAESGLVNIVGGCCGTTPDHIEAIATEATKFEPRRLQEALVNE